MMKRLLLLLSLWATVGVAAVAATTAFSASTGTYMNFHFPSTLSRGDGGWDHSMGHFGRSEMALSSHVGYEAYGSLSAQVYQAPTRDLCHHVNTDNSTSPQYNVPFVFFVWRSPNCTYVTQTRRAQHMGASAVIIADYLCIDSDGDNCHNDNGGDKSQHETPIIADDGSGGDVTIPALFVRKQDGQAIVDVLVPNDNDNDSNNHRPVMVTLRWEPPSANSTVTNKGKTKTPNKEKVFYGMTFDLMDHHTAEFTSNIRHIALAFGKDATFYPSYLIYDGSKIGCTDHQEECELTCINGGRYCYPHIKGNEVVREVLRRICIWQSYGDNSTYNNHPIAGAGSGLERGEAFWNYIEYFDGNCAANQFTVDEGNPKKKDEQTKKRTKCLNDAYKKAKIRQDTIKSCIKLSGSDGENDGPNSLLDKHLGQLQRYGITVAPSIWVQNLTVPNYWRPPTPTGLMQALCGSFNWKAGSSSGGGVPTACKRCLKKLNDEDILSCTKTYYDDHYKHPHRHIWRTFFLFIFICFGSVAGYIMYRRQQDGMDLSSDVLYNPLRNVNDRLQNMRNAYMPLGGGGGGGSGSGEADSTMNGGPSAASLLPGSGSSINGSMSEDPGDVNAILQEDGANPFQ